MLTQIETDDYNLSSTGDKYAELFKTWTNIKNANHYNDNQIIFEVYHMSSSSGVIEPKRFLLTLVRNNSTDIINFIDLTPNVRGITIGYINNDGLVTVYGKGSKTGAKIKVQIIYCSCLGMYEFINNGKFTNDVEVIKPKNNLLCCTNNTGKTPNSMNYFIDTNYRKILTLTPYWGGPVGTITLLITNVGSSTLKNILYVVTLAYNNTNGKINYITSNPINHRLEFALTKKDNNLNFYIKSSYEYFDILVTPLCHQIDENAYYKFVNEKIENLSENETIISSIPCNEKIEINLQNNWTKDDYFLNYAIRKDNNCEVSLMCYNGDITQNSVICKLPYKPLISKYVPCVALVGEASNEYFQGGLLFLEKNGDLKVHTLPSNKRVVCNINFSINDIQ